MANYKVISHLEHLQSLLASWLTSCTEHSVWKPLFGPLQDWPLGLLDYQSVNSERDLEASDNIYVHVVRETYNVYFHPDHRWYYLAGQKPDEIMVFKSLDSAPDRRIARCSCHRILCEGTEIQCADVIIVCPHASFDNSPADSKARPRESFECQSIVIHPKS